MVFGNNLRRQTEFGGERIRSYMQKAMALQLKSIRVGGIKNHKSIEITIKKIFI